MANSPGEALERELLYQFNHVFLPPRTPQKDDTDLQLEMALVSSVHDAMDDFQKHLHDPTPPLQMAFAMLQRMLRLRTTELGFSPGSLEEQIRSMGGTEDTDFLLLHLRAQNAGLLITSTTNEYVFEAFELLASNKSATSSPSGRLIRHFPNSACAVSRSTVLGQGFLSELVYVLEKIDLESAAVASPQTKKAATYISEERDTVSPFLVTEMLVGVFLGVGEPVDGSVRIIKHSREQVNWEDTAVSWHRSAAWLLLRVGLRLVLDRAAEPAKILDSKNAVPSMYKPFMAYFMGAITRKACHNNLPSETIHIMSSKVSRRLQKLNPSDTDSWAKETLQTLVESAELLQTRWKSAQQAEAERSSLDFGLLQSLDFESDAVLAVPNFHSYLRWVDSRQPPAAGGEGLGDRTKFYRASQDELPNVSTGSQDMVTFSLIHFESWVALYLQNWLDGRGTTQSSEQNMQSLAMLIDEYYRRASSTYSKCPESLSRMYLTVMELWVALDKLACLAIPLLLQYDHGIPPDLLYPLVLPRREQMVRLHRVEEHLLQRSRVKFPVPFTDFGRSNSFAVRFFDQSNKHQCLLGNILADAEQQRQRKCDELSLLKALYSQLSDQIANGSHQTRYDEDDEEYYCVPKCKVCGWTRQRNDLRISVHEWPLPADSLAAKAAVFEINVPKTVAIWRDTTLKLLTDVFQSDARTEPEQVKLWLLFNFGGLSEFRSRQTRVHLASTTKPFTVSHYSSQLVSQTNKSSICVPHGCRYEYYDNDQPIMESLESPQIPGISFAKAIRDPQLRCWATSAVHTSNETIARQSECPAHMRVDAARAFGHLRAGVRIQWANILCQLLSPALDFDAQDTCLLILQASGEAGPAEGSALRQAHELAQSDHFLDSSVDALGQSLDRIEESWGHLGTLTCLVILSVRLLSLAPSRDKYMWCALLSRLRAVAYKWSEELLGKYSMSKPGTEAAGWSKDAFSSLLTCIATFDAGPEILAAVLESDNEAAILVEVFIHAQEHQPENGAPTDPVQLALFQRWRQIACQCQQILERDIVETSRDYLDRAIKRVWRDFPGSSTWSHGSGYQRHILSTSINTNGSQRSIGVTYNLLTGSLLVNKSPLTKLPTEFQEASTYRRLFGSRSLDVMPSAVEEMQFSATMPHEGFFLHFAMNGTTLIVHAIQDGRTLEFIPSTHFKGDLPSWFVESCSHWLDLDTREVEFRPAARPWASSPDNWRMRLTKGRYELLRGSRRLIEPTSPTGSSISHILRWIEAAPHLHLILNTELMRLDIDLQSTGINFFLQKGETCIKSKQYEGTCIDESQEFGSLIGLRNKVVLRPETNSHKISSGRHVIIPDGHISFQILKENTSVQIQNSATSAHQTYLIDENLGRLVDRGSLRSKLLLIYLHALTSHCLVDPLTGRTGTEEGLLMLKSGAVTSFQRLESQCESLLELISRISPARNYYPDYLMAMERTEWSSLPSLSQHEGFCQTVQAIQEHATDCEKFCDDGTRKGKILCTESSQSLLVRRAMIRNSAFYVSEFGAEEYNTADDVEYPGREKSSLMVRVYQSTTFLDQGSQMLPIQLSDAVKAMVIRLLGSEIQGPLVSTLNSLAARFDVGWLQDPSTVLPKYWCMLDSALTSTVPLGKYRLIFLFAGMIFAKNAIWEVVNLLLARTQIRSVREIPLPDEPCFRRSYGSAPSMSQLRPIIKLGALDLMDCPEGLLPKLVGETKRQFRKRRDRAWESASEAHIKLLAQAILRLWPARDITLPEVPGCQTYIRIGSIRVHILELFMETWRNREFDSYLDSIVYAASQIPASLPAIRHASYTILEPPKHHPAFVSSCSLMSTPAPQLWIPQTPDFSRHYKWTSGNAGGARLLGLLIELMGLALRSGRTSRHGAQYIEELLGSFKAFLREGDSQSTAWLCDSDADRLVAFQVHLRACREELGEMRQEIESCLQPESIADRAAYATHNWPRVSTAFLLQRLSRRYWSGLPQDWQKCIVCFALCMTYLQQAERLLNARCQPTDLIRELTSSVHTWDPFEFPESLLLEVEQGLLIRKVQDDVASQMRDPRDGRSSIMQLNMGEGKSSVIVPIIAAALADGTRLVRIIVGKSQSKQMAHILVSRLGGLLNRRVFFLPFSRSLSLDRDGVLRIQKMLRDCQSQGGVLLVQPEHLLSFQLMGLEYCGSGGATAQTGQQILSSHDEWRQSARDIVDESDDNFSVKFELIYTMGTQQSVDYRPGRWTVIQDVLQLVRTIAKTSHADYGAGLQYEEREHGNFPSIRILEAAAGDRFLAIVAQHICTRGLREFPIQHQPPCIREAVLRYIYDVSVSDADIQTVEGGDTPFASDSVIQPLLLLRGLFARGILAFALHQKRFRVNYGLAPDRRPQAMLAVPFRAKDSPSPRSEFSHPDVVIVLTCLSYYYQGLSDAELTVCFERLVQSDRAEQEYDSWAQQSSLPPSLRYFSAVNVKDRNQCINSVFPALRRVKPAVDFYLSQVVFPKEMREFPSKLSASGWDLAKRKQHPLTGFSGTNDSKYVLPLAVHSLDLPEQQHTNAAVLDCLLGSENQVMEIGSAVGGASSGCQLTAEMLLLAVADSNPEVQVILDVGAQIIELNNKAMAQTWLAQTAADKAEAVIFFDDHDELMVVARNGSVEKFITSPFSSRTDRCLVFLDQAHTRGTDLRLPDHFRAAVTLGPKITKDTLVQACMRMRKLGRGQSVIFCVSPEMQHKIRTLRRKESTKNLTVSDVLVWSIIETWDETMRSIPLWAVQGVRHNKQSKIWDRVATEKGPVFFTDDVNEYLEDEAETIQQRYHPDCAHARIDVIAGSAESGTELAAIKEKCDLFGITTLGGAILQEEQERELAPEVEEERQDERPPVATPRGHRLHEDVKEFVARGYSNRLGDGVLPAYSVLSGTSAAQDFSVVNFDREPQELLASEDFAHTIQDIITCSDAYQRPVQWILSGHPAGNITEKPQQLLIISPWEANELLKQMRSAKYAVLHLYSPRKGLSYRSMESLTVFTVPEVPASWRAPKLIITQLNLFAGQMYLESYEEYSRLCSFLGVSQTENTDDTALPADGFIGRQPGNSECTFEASPVQFLKVLYSKIRGDYLDIRETHMGRILAGEILSEETFEGI